MKENLRVLVIAPFYDSFPFVGELIDATSKYVEHIDVLIHHNYLAELAPYIPHPYFRWVERFTKKNLAGLKPKPKNLKVHVLSTLYFTPDGRNRGLGDKLYRKFSRYIKEHNLEFDIIHAHMHWPQGYVAVKLGEEFDVPTVVTIHATQTDLSPILSLQNSSKYDHIHFVFRNASALIRVNQKDIPALKRFNSNVYYVPNGFNPDRVGAMSKSEARATLGLPEDKKIIFSLGNLVERKGFQYLIVAMKGIIKDRRDITCFIGGDGPFKNELEKLIKKSKLQENVKLLGYVPDEQLKYWMNAADLFVLPSLSEGNPTVMFEALGVGLPFVGTAVGGVPEIITSEDYGLLCPPADSECLAEKILIALEKEWDREKIRKYGEQFTWDNIV
ncbi:MAG: glycosyltransferase family 4 protein, partial [Candidatus Thorarchaeota archaeon]